MRSSPLALDVIDVNETYLTEYASKFTNPWTQTVRKASRQVLQASEGAGLRRSTVDFASKLSASKKVESLYQTEYQQRFCSPSGGCDLSCGIDDKFLSPRSLRRTRQRSGKATTGRLHANIFKDTDELSCLDDKRSNDLASSTAVFGDRTVNHLAAVYRQRALQEQGEDHRPRSGPDIARPEHKSTSQQQEPSKSNKKRSTKLQIAVPGNTARQQVLTEYQQRFCSPTGGCDRRCLVKL